jgi:hypothetical protein
MALAVTTPILFDHSARKMAKRTMGVMPCFITFRALLSGATGGDDDDDGDGATGYDDNGVGATGDEVGDDDGEGTMSDDDDGDGATGNEVDDDGDDDDYGDGQ